MERHVFIRILIYFLYVETFARNPETHAIQTFTIDQLLTKQFPRKSSFDRDVDICKWKSTHEANRHAKVLKRRPRAATSMKSRLWTYGVIPYEIGPGFNGEHRTLFKQAMRHWELNTCVTFVERDPDVHPNYVYFTERSCGCCSFVGKRGNGAQAISIGSKCDKFGIVVHELGHVVGFWHEHTRPDRDQHVKILHENILPSQEYNFNKLSANDIDSLGLPYDFQSIMHYSRNTFSKNPYLDTIVPVVEDMGSYGSLDVGQRVRLSEGDIKQANLLYRCTACGATLQDPTATFASPTHPNPYSGPGETCQWRISATNGERIRLTIKDLDLFETEACQTDYLIVYDGYWPKSPILGRFCGIFNDSKEVVSSGSRLLVDFVTSKNHSGRRGFSAIYQTICGGELAVNNSGTLESPNFPDFYPRNKDCTWILRVPTNYSIVVHFHFFDIEKHDNCSSDFIQIFDGPSSDAPELGKFCGYQPPLNVRSRGSSLTVHFRSDATVQRGGFQASFIKELDECDMSDHGCEQVCVNTVGSFQCQCRIGFELRSDGKTCEEACGGTLDGPNGTITSPSFPELYPPDKKCIWEILAPVNHIIIVNFTHFDLEGNKGYGKECDYDNLTIASVQGRTIIRDHGTYCGSRSPAIIASNSTVLRITFNSDSSVHKSGFGAIYFLDKNECSMANGNCDHTCENTIGSYKCSCNDGFLLKPDNHTCHQGECKFDITAQTGVISSPNYPNAYPGQLDCVWQLQTTAGHRIKVIFDDFDLEVHQECAYDHISVYFGDTTMSKSIGRLCGSKLPPPIISTNNKLLMILKSDASLQRHGFKARHMTTCGGYLRAAADVKYFYSHVKYGVENYENNVDCEWVVQVMSEHAVNLTFWTFDLETGDNCSYDFVKVYDGYDSGGYLHGKYCGNRVDPIQIISRGSAIIVKFSTDQDITGQGFKASYVAVDQYAEIKRLETGLIESDYDLVDDYDD